MDSSKLVESFLRRQGAVKRWMEGVLDYSLDNENEDFWEQLKTGVDLCRLMLKIKEMSIPSVHENPRLQFRKKENIVFFIEAAKEYGVPLNCLFDVTDLFDERSLNRVLECLESLAGRANSAGIEPKFIPEQASKVTLKLPSIAKDSNRAQKRTTMLLRTSPVPGGGMDWLLAGSSSNADLNANKSNQADIESSPNSFSLPSRSPPNQKDNAFPQTNPTGITKLDLSKVSSSLPPSTPLPLSPREKEQVFRSVSFLVSAARGRLARRSHQKRVTDAAYRARVAKEILDTEQVYVSNLTLLEDLFFSPLLENSLSSKPLLSTDEVKTIFGSVGIIKAYNAKLLAEIKPCVETWGPNKRLGDIFLKICEFLKVYTSYVATFNSSVQILAECKNKKEKFANWLNEKEALPEVQGLKLPALLILPVQRIPRYSLLLSDLSKHTWKSHSDYDDLVKATTAMNNVASYLNEKKREADSITKVTEIFDNWLGHHLAASPQRRFVKEVSVKVLGNKEQKERKFYFFNDILVITKPYRATIGILHAKSEKQKEKVVSHHDYAAITAVPSSGFQFTLCMSNGDALYSIDAGSLNLRDECVTMIQQSSEQKVRMSLMIGNNGNSPSSSSDSIEKHDKSEKHEKHDKNEKGEKGDKKNRPTKKSNKLFRFRASTLHSDPNRKSMEDPTSSSTETSPHNSVHLNLTNVESQLTMSSLSPRNSREEGATLLHRSESSTTLSAILSPREEPFITSHEAPDTIGRRPSFKRSNTEFGPAVPTKPAHMRSLLIPTTGSAPPAMAPPSIPERAPSGPLGLSSNSVGSTGTSSSAAPGTPSGTSGTPSNAGSVPSKKAGIKRAGTVGAPGSLRKVQASKLPPLNVGTTPGESSDTSAPSSSSSTPAPSSPNAPSSPASNTPSSNSPSIAPTSRPLPPVMNQVNGSAGTATDTIASPSSRPKKPLPPPPPTPQTSTTST